MEILHGVTRERPITMARFRINGDSSCTQSDGIGSAVLRNALLMPSNAKKPPRRGSRSGNGAVQIAVSVLVTMQIRDADRRTDRPRFFSLPASRKHVEDPFEDPSTRGGRIVDPSLRFVTLRCSVFLINRSGGSSRWRMFLSRVPDSL